MDPCQRELPYLDERSLGRFLRERLDSGIIANAQIPDIARRFRPDYRCERHRLVIEFDGDQHYRRAVHVLKDAARDAVLTDAGYRDHSYPLFRTADIGHHTAPVRDARRRPVAVQRLPARFIADTVIFPADFCELGIARFQQDLERFSFIKADIFASLEKAAVARGDWRLVYPPALREWLGASGSGRTRL